MTDDVDPDDAITVGLKVIEMADRVRTADWFAKGATATWAFEMNGRTYRVAVTVDE